MTRPLLLLLPDGERYAPLHEAIPRLAEELALPVELDLLPPPEITRRLLAGPDPARPVGLVGVHDHSLPATAHRLLPLDDLLEEDPAADMDPDALARCRWDGALLALPRQRETRLLFYRSDLFEDRRQREWFRERTGGRELRLPETWAELAVVAQHFAEPGGLAGFAFAGREAGLVALFSEIVHASGGSVWAPDGSLRVYTRAGEWALSLLRDLVVRWKAAPEETPEFDAEDAAAHFRLGHSAMVMDVPNAARYLCDPSFSAVAAWHSVTLPPRGAGQRRAAWTGTPGFALPVECPDPRGAFRLLQALVSPESQRLEAKYGAYPARLSVRNAVREELLPGTLAHRRLEHVERTLSEAALEPPRVPGWWETEERLWRLLRRAVSGELPVLEVLAAAAGTGAPPAAPEPEGPPEVEVRPAGTREEVLAALEVRRAVFVREQKGPAEEEPDPWDDAALHLVALAGGRVVGTARLFHPAEGVGKIGRLAVLPEFRRLGIGARLLDEAIAAAEARGMREAVLDAQVYLLPFYGGRGFEECGPEFLDAGIPHRPMRRLLSFRETLHP